MKKTMLISIIILSFTLFTFYNAFSCEGEIHGQVYYSGGQSGSVIVAIFNLQLDFNELILLDTLETGPDSYDFIGLCDGTYLVAAFMDVNGDGIPGFTEPLGAHPKTVEISNNIVDSVDIYIKELPRGTGSISGKVRYDGLLKGKIHVLVMGLTGTPFNFYCPPDGDSTYTISGLISGEYILVAFLDIDGNGQPDIGEPVGYYEDEIKVGDSEHLTEYDLTLFDPGEFSGSIYGTINYTGSDSGTIYIYTVGLAHTPISITEVNYPETSYKISNLDQGEYYTFAFLDTNSNNTFDPMRIELDTLSTFIPIKFIPGEPYELVAEPIVLADGENKEQNLILNDKGDAGISGSITYNGDQLGLVLVVALGFSPSWFGLYPANFESPHQYSYTVPYLDAGHYGVIGFMINPGNPTFDLNMPIGFYTEDLVSVTAHDTVTGIDFFLEDSTSATSAITGAITTPEGLEGDIFLFSLGISLTPYWYEVLTSERTYTIPDLRMGRYLVGGFMDVDGNGTFDLDEPFAITESLIEIPYGDTVVVVNLDLKVQVTRLEIVSQNFQPDEFALGDNYPNPFNPNTTVQYHLAESRTVSIKVFNLLGSEVRTLIDKKQHSGIHEINWDGRDNQGKDVASGIYLYCLKAGEFLEFKKMTLIR